MVRGTSFFLKGRVNFFGSSANRVGKKYL